MKRIIQCADQIVIKVNNVFSIASGISICLMVLLVTLEVLLRNLFQASTLIADEYAGYLLVAMLFFGVAYTFRTKRFIRVDLLYGRFKGKAKFIVDLILFIVALAYTSILLQYLFDFTMQSYKFHSQSTFYSRTPLFIPQTVMVLGLFSLAVEISLNLVKHLLGMETVSTHIEEEGGTHI